MNKIKISLLVFEIAFIFSFVQTGYSQVNTNTNAGTLFCDIDGDTLTWALMSAQAHSPDYFQVLTAFGPSDKGVIKIQWNDITNPADIKTGTLELEKGFVESADKKIHIMWADITNQPYIIKKGKLTVTENTGSTIRGTLELTCELGGSSIISEFLKGKTETVLKQGYFEINY
ncbi:MAG: hypothetical protein L0Y77_02155 [Chlorobi bacterium]|nr:hypothetical protein [Chlorobiota bacterium]